jgi:hypothetical protein
MGPVKPSNDRLGNVDAPLPDIIKSLVVKVRRFSRPFNERRPALLVIDNPPHVLNDLNPATLGNAALLLMIMAPLTWTRLINVGSTNDGLESMSNDDILPLSY